MFWGQDQDFPYPVAWNLNYNKILHTCLHLTSRLPAFGTWWMIICFAALFFQLPISLCSEEISLVTPPAFITFVAIFQHCCFVVPSLVFCRVITQFSMKAWNAWKRFAQPYCAAPRLCCLKVGGALADLFWFSLSASRTTSDFLTGECWWMVVDSLCSWKSLWF